MANENSFSALISGTNKFTRRFGGNAPGITVDPYLTGYCFMSFADLPDGIAAYLNDVTTTSTDLNLNMASIKNFLESSMLSLTLPGGTMNKTEFTGIGGVKTSAPTNADYDNSFSIRFLEFQGLPLLHIISGWFNMIRDFRTGSSKLNSGGNYIKSNYAGSLYYWTTLPDSKTVQFSSLLTGVFPTVDPLDQYGHDISTIDKLEIDIDFNVDYVWRSDWVADNCSRLATIYQISGDNSTTIYGRADANVS